ncbi:MAG: hemolysin family protein [Solitalea-like symbiont of Tyrophagus putrescentiae]
MSVSSITLGIIWIALLIILNGFFVAAEFALVKVRASQIQIKIKDGDKRAKQVGSILTKNLDGYLAATQLGITFTSLGLGWIGEAVMLKLIRLLFSAFNISLASGIEHFIAIPIAFIIITALHIVFGELMPKTLAIQRSVRVSLFVAFPLHIFYIVFKPFIWTLNGFANIMLKPLHLHPVSLSEAHSSEELQMLLEQSEKQGVLEKSELNLLRNVFDFKDRIVKNIIVPRTEIIAAEIDASIDEVIDTIIAEGYTRMPVYEKSIDNIVGIVHTKDLLAIIKDNQNNKTLKDIIREPYFVPETKKIDDLLKELQKTNTIMVIVLDEFGGTAGLITLEDIVEELVGEIQDEYDAEQPKIKKLEEDAYMVNALAAIADINEHLPTPLPQEDEYDTVAGLMNFIFEKIPEEGDTKTHCGYQFTILTKHNRKVETVKLIKLKDQPECHNQENE